MIKTMVIGNGNVAEHLYSAFSVAKGVDVRQISSRNISALPDADVYLIAVSDNAIGKVSKRLNLKAGLVVHTSGSMGVDAISLSGDRVRRGVFYPLQTFSKGREVSFGEIPICLEAENGEDIKLLKKLAEQVSNTVHVVDSGRRKALHTAAVFVNNFVNHLYRIGHDISADNGLPFRLLHPLILETARKATRMTPAEAQTGPARRGDVETITQQLDGLSKPDHIAIYKLLSQCLTEAYK